MLPYKTKYMGALITPTNHNTPDIDFITRKEVAEKYMNKLLSKLIAIYDDFEPTIEWVHHDDHDTLLVYLPDFRRNQLKLLASSTQQLKIIGERPLGNNKRRRFKTELAISSNYDSDKISAKFENGVLHVKHPLKIRSRTVTQGKLQENASQVMPETSTELYEQAGPNQKTQQHLEENPQKASGDRSWEDESGLVTNTCEVSKFELKCQCREAVWVRMAEIIRKAIQPANIVMFVMSLIILVIGLLYIKSAIWS